MGLADQVIGVKAKKFLMQSIYLFASKYSKIVSNWVEQVSEIIEQTVEQSFDPDERKLEENTAKFLQWLGFSPVDVKWYPEQKIGRFMIGTSRMWQDPKTDNVTKVIMHSLIGSLGKKLLGEKPDVSQITGQLPPRIIVGYEIRERYGDISPIDIADTPQVDVIQPTKNSESESGSKPTTTKITSTRYKSLIEPFIGPDIDEALAAKTLMEETLDLLKEKYPADLESYNLGNLNLLLFLFQRSAKEEKWKESASDLGKRFAGKMREFYPNTEPNGAIEGMGALKPDSFDEFLFYGKHQTSEEFCNFIAIIFQEYVSVFMDLEFKADKPLCATSGSNLCLYAYIK
ncbi:MAG: hypothetical protein HeimC3_48610 [Candidatus Heimdallarchaeota archaeon LC_3]|nr:MAG: hypothetical protein HeimC3_48610 [Candidatus Heimdallarchaeota archaeon LC_3]